MDYFLVLLLGIAACYPTRALLLMERESHEGPFWTKNKLVRFDTGHIQHVSIFDWIRRPFGIYDIKGDYWNVRDINMTQLFTCEFCLSFWTSVPFTIFFIAEGGLRGSELLWVIPVHFAIAIIAQLAYKVLWE